MSDPALLAGGQALLQLRRQHLLETLELSIEDLLRLHERIGDFVGGRPHPIGLMGFGQTRHAVEVSLGKH